MKIALCTLLWICAYLLIEQPWLERRGRSNGIRWIGGAAFIAAIGVMSIGS